MGFLSDLNEGLKSFGKGFRSVITFGASDRLEEAKNIYNLRNRELENVQKDFLRERERTMEVLGDEAHNKVVSVELLKEIRERFKALKSENSFIYKIRLIDYGIIRLKPSTIFKNVFKSVALSSELFIDISSDLATINGLYHKSFASKHVVSKHYASNHASVLAKTKSTTYLSSKPFVAKATGVKLLGGKAVTTAVLTKSTMAGTTMVASKGILTGVLGTFALPFVIIGGALFENLNVRSKIENIQKEVFKLNNEIDVLNKKIIKCIKIQNSSQERLANVIEVQKNIETSVFILEQEIVEIFGSFKLVKRIWAKFCLFFGLPNKDLTKIRGAKVRTKQQINQLIRLVKQN
ncbi:MAG: hypothetical protein NXI00_02940 [Cytophagales bacterium]|nr:hypothetical protein [Cytophagales bacterium]